MTRRMQHRTWLLVLAAVAPLLAQAPDESTHLGATTAAPCDRIPVHTQARGAGEPAYGIWAAGASYKARFDDGMTFYPCLGRDYPHNQPFAWRTLSVRVGALELWGEQPPTTTQGAYRFEYTNGTVREAYDVLAHGLEQTFVLATRPAAAGDLVIRGRITTALHTPPVHEVVGPLVWSDANETPILCYGQAIAIDAHGDRVAVTTTVSDGEILLRVAAADVARADFPLVVDPLLAPITSANVGSTVAIGETDCATETNAPSNTTSFVYTRHFSATDADVFSYASVVSIAGPTPAFVDLLASTSATHGRLAHVAATNRWVLVYESLTTATQQMQVRAATFPGGVVSPTASASVPLPASTNVHQWRPAVSGIAEGGTGSQALVVFQRESGLPTFANSNISQVHGVFFDTATIPGTFGSTFPIQASATLDNERPSVNRMAEGGAAFSRLVVWQSFDNTIAGDDWDVLGVLVDQAGAVSPMWQSTALSGHKLGPVVDGRSGRWCVAFAGASATVGKVADELGNEIRCKRLDWQHGSATPSGDATLAYETQQTNASRVLEATGIAHNGSSRSHWAIAWRANGTTTTSYATRVGYQGKSLQTPDVVAATGSASPGPASVLHHDAFGVTSLCWMATTGGNGTIYGRSFSYTNSFPSVEGTACTTGGLQWTGPALSGAGADNLRIGSELAGPSVIQAPNNGLHLLLVGLTPANVPVSHPILAANCTLLVPFSGPDYLGALPLAVGNSVTWQLPLPEALPPLTIYLQDWILDPATSLFGGTRRLVVPLTK